MLKVVLHQLTWVSVGLVAIYHRLEFNDILSTNTTKESDLDMRRQARFGCESQDVASSPVHSQSDARIDPTNKKRSVTRKRSAGEFANLAEMKNLLSALLLSMLFQMAQKVTSRIHPNSTTTPVALFCTKSRTGFLDSLPLFRIYGFTSETPKH